MHVKNKTPRRIICVSVVFIAVCFIYILKMVNIRINAEPAAEDDGTYTRTVAIQAVRGEIYDKNGKKLVSNDYSYNMVFDYEAMSADRYERNLALLNAVYALNDTGNSSKRSESSFPFVGAYPDYAYSDAAKDTDSNIYYRLLKRIAADELEEDSPKKKNELTATYLEGFYKDYPEQFPKEEEIVAYFIERYELDIKDDDGNMLFSDGEIDILIRILYDMEVADFSAFNQYVFASDVGLDFITYVKEMNIVGADFTVTVSRVYNYPGYASHILGRTGQIYAEDWEYYNELGYEMDAVVGLDGCEYAFEQYLRGVDGVMVIKEDKDGNIIDKYVETEPVPGKDIYLTIDIDVQIAAEEGLKENIDYVNKTYGADSESGAIVAVNPNDGSIIAIASYPTFDLSTYNRDYSELSKNPANPLYNRALDGLYTPGSVFKLGMVAAGIDSGTITAQTKLNCDGIYTYYPDYQPKCWVYDSVSSPIHKHGMINATEAIKVSCNCFFYELGRVMGIDLMNDYCKRYGLGSMTGIELPEKRGILAGPEYRELNGLTAWMPGNTISAAIGQSDNNFTPIQLSVYVSTVLNGGTRYSAHLLSQVRSYKNSEVIYTREAEVLDNLEFGKEITDPIMEGMRQMIESSSSVSYYMRNIPVIVGGKSGTAELGGNTRENGLFVCAAPYNAPEIIVTSVVEHAGSGSYSALAAARLLEEYFSPKTTGKTVSE